MQNVVLGSDKIDIRNPKMLNLDITDDDKIDNDYDNTINSESDEYYLPSNIIFPSSKGFYIFSWITKIISLRQIKTLSKDDMLRLPFAWKAKNIFAAFKFYWKTHNFDKTNTIDSSNRNRYEKLDIEDKNYDKSNINIDDIKTKFDEDRPSTIDKNCKRLWWTLHSLIFYNFWYSGLCRLLNDLLLIFGVYIIKAIISAATESQRNFVTLFVLASLLTASNILQAIFLQQFIHSSFVCGSITVSASSSCVLHSVLAIRMHKLNKDSTISLGEINNIYSKDAASLREFVVFFHNLWACPLLIVMCVLTLFFLVGYAGIVALILLIMLLPVESLITKKAKVAKKNAKVCADKRMSLINELIDGFKTAKLTNLCPLIYNLVSNIRKEEMTFAWQSSTIENINMVISRSSALLITLITLLVFIIIVSYSSSSKISADRIFAALAVINMLGRPLQVLPKCVSLYTDAVVSCERMQSLINEAEQYGDIFTINSNYDNENQLSPLQNKEDLRCGINLRNVNVKRGDRLVLTDIDFEIKNPGLYVIIGDNASGKTSLLLTILHELKYIGCVSVYPADIKIAYLSHDCWICKRTAKENILMASNIMKLTDDEYLSSLRACDLEYDFQEWIRGDNTIIDQNSISGGQSQRISLARALCSDSSIFLMDSVLSGLDVKSVEHVFHQGILPKSRKNIVLLTTHNKDLIKYSDYVIQLENGKVIYYGARQDYVVNSDSELKISKVVTSLIESKSKEDNNNLKSTEKNKEDLDITDSSSITIAVLYYIRACTFSNVTFALLLTILSYVLTATADYFIVYWTEKSWKSSKFLLLYSTMLILVISTNFFRYCMYAYSGNVGSITIHNNLLNSIIGASFKFLNNTPPGRIAARFSSDLDVIDNQLPSSISSLVDSIMGILTGVGVVCVTAPYYIFIVIPLTLLYLNIQNKYRLASLEFKKIEAGSKSPLYSFFREIVSGLDTARGYRIQEKLINRHDELLDNLITARMNWDAGNRWLGIRLDLIGVFIISGASFAVTFSSSSGGTSGIMLSYALKATQSLSFAVRAATALENLLTSLDRVKEFCSAEQEEEIDISHTFEMCDNASGLEMTKLLADDNISSALTLSNVNAKYADDLPLSMKAISFSVLPSQLVGICGRTGSGKSSLALILSRLLHTTSGSICLGNRNINSISLSEYRNYVTIFPQDTYIFSGTLRACLDPSNLHTDMKLNSLLSEFIAALSDNDIDNNQGSFLHLELKISANGKNLSAGQRQIVTLARAILSANFNESNEYTKIIVLDEITSNLDANAAKKVISIIKKELSPSLAVLLISHRMADLEMCDTLIVLSDGKIVSQGLPSVLMKDMN